MYWSQCLSSLIRGTWATRNPRLIVFGDALARTGFGGYSMDRALEHFRQTSPGVGRAMRKHRVARLVTIIAIALSVAPMVAKASADPYPWCAISGSSGSTNCSFVTLAQCRATISGIGGFCEPNSLFTGPPAPVGHRQPMAKDLPAEILWNEQKTIRSQKNPNICKGC